MNLHQTKALMDAKLTDKCFDAYIVLVGLDDEGRLIVHDPNSAERTEQTWDLQTVLRQCRNIWAFSAA